MHGHLLPDEIHTLRLHLRAPRMEDAHAIFQSYAQDPEVSRYLVWTPHATEAATQAFIASCIGSWSNCDHQPYVIAERDTDLAIGMADVRMHGTTVELGYVLARAHWGKGFMPEAVRSLTAAALETPRVYRVQANCDTENIASQRALEKAGFMREGRLDRYMVHPNLSPQPRACYLYAQCK